MNQKRDERPSVALNPPPDATANERAAHTPGPWIAIHDPGYKSDDMVDNGGYRIDAPGERVTQLAYVWVLNHRHPGGGQPQETGPLFGDVRAAANARLIAAAPELIAPFKDADNEHWRVLDLLLGPTVYGQFWRGAFKEFRAALAKATGRMTTAQPENTNDNPS